MNLQDEINRRLVRGARYFECPLARDEAFSLDENFLIRAGAGSGKTSVLIERMVALVRSGIPVDQIVAITFTRKAAGEMRGRFQVQLRLAEKGLLQAIEGSRQNKEAFNREHFELELNFIRTARSSEKGAFTDTIHAFASLLLRTHPFLSGVPADATILDDEEDLLLGRKFWNGYVSKTLIDEPEWSERFDRSGIQPLKLFDYFRMRSSLSHVYVENTDVEQPDLQEAAEQTDIYLSWIAERMPLVHPLDRISTAATDALRFKRVFGIDSHANRATFLGKLEAVARDDGSLYPNSIKVTKWGTDRSSPGRRAAEVLMGRETSEEGIVSLSVFVQKIIQPALKSWRAFLHAEIVRFTNPAVAEYVRFRKQNGKLTYSDLLRLSVESIRNSPDLRRLVRRKYSRILVDEFQDTDPLQSELIFLMASEDDGATDWHESRPSPGSLFLVGDEKQSIFRFRQADLRVFAQVGERIAATGGRVIHLGSNFRSSEPICNWVNSAVGPLFQPDESEFQARYEPLMAVRGPASNERSIFQLCLEKVSGDNAAVVALADAKTIASCISDAVRRSESSLLKMENASYGDFLILVRTANRIELYASALEEKGIPYTTAGAKVKTGTGILAPIVDLIDTVYNPHDPIARLAYLRGPFSGLSDDALFQFVRHNGAYTSPVFIPQDLSPELREAFQDAFQTLALAKKLFHRFPLSDATEQLFSVRGLMAAFTESKGASAKAGLLQRLISKMRGWESSGSAWTDVRNELHRIHEGEIELEGMTLEAGRQDVVRLFNIHQAKGLESSVVFLADPLQKDSTADVSFHVERSEDGDRLLMPVIEKRGFQRRRIAEPLSWRRAVEEESRFSDAENIRLVYVAATRAKNALVVSRYRGRDDIGTWRMLYAGLDAADATVINQISASEKTEYSGRGADAEETADLFDQFITRLESARETMDRISRPSYESISVTALSTALKAGSANRLEDASGLIAADRDHKHGENGGIHERDDDGTSKSFGVGIGSSGLRFGNVVHRIFESAVQRRARQSRSEVNRHDVERVMIEEMGRPDEAAISRVLEMLAEFKRSSIWKSVATAERVWTELEFSTPKFTSGQTTIVSGKIDLVYLNDGAYTIVDYKTDRTDLESLRVKYADQVRGYSEALRALTGAENVTCGIWWTQERGWIRV